MDSLARTCDECGRELPSGADGSVCSECLRELLRRGIEWSSPEDGRTPREEADPMAWMSEAAAALPRLEFLDVAGRGGMGVVYKVRQLELDRPAALKLLPPRLGSSPFAAQRFVREFQALARLSHPGIVTIYDAGQAGRFLYYLMEFVDGWSLDRRLQRGRMALTETREIIRQVGAGLEYAHQKGVAHRDVKPGNILLDRRQRALVADFGIAKLLDLDEARATLTGERQVLGTPVYMAPEQMEEATVADHRADIYSLGAVCYEMVTGRRPAGRFELPARELGFDSRLDAALAAALEPDPNRRFQTVGEFVDAFLTATQSVSETRLESSPTVEVKTPALAAPSGGHSSSRARWVGIGGAAAALAAALFWMSREPAGWRPGRDGTLPELGISMVWIPSGSFAMGDPEAVTAEGYESKNEYPGITVTVSRGFWMGAYEVTRSQYRRVTGQSIEALEEFAVMPGADDRLPATFVTWSQATNFCWLLTQSKQGAGGLPEGYVFRLPTEAEWERACRANSDARYSFGESEASLPDYGWFESNSRGRLHPVGLKIPNRWGLFDMHGNAWEWCLDWYWAYDALGTEAVDPVGWRPPEEEVWTRIARGGCIDEPAWNCRSACRTSNEPDEALSNVGFRIVLAPEEPLKTME